MRNLLLAAAFALGLGFAATGAQASAIGSNVACIETAAKTGNPLVVKDYYRRHWRHRGWRHGYYHRGWRHGYYHRGWHHRYYWRHHRRHYWR
jgi:hypothetical protein